MSAEDDELKYLEQLTQALCTIAEGAGGEIMQIYETEFKVQDKADQSPVTDADTRAYWQMRAMLLYIENRYGSASEAWKFWKANRYY